MARAEVTRVEISSRQDALGGKSFGTNCAYEKLTGKVYFAVDPNNPHNKIIADIDKAPEQPRESGILRRPVHSQAKGSFRATVFSSSTFRTVDATGAKRAQSRQSIGRSATEEEFGDGLLMREGYTVVSVGWEFDIPRKRDCPAGRSGRLPITGSPSLAG